MDEAQRQKMIVLPRRNISLVSFCVSRLYSPLYLYCQHRNWNLRYILVFFMKGKRSGFRSSFTPTLRFEQSSQRLHVTFRGCCFDYEANFLAILVRCLPKSFAIFSSLADGMRSPIGPAIVEAPYGEPPVISSIVICSLEEYGKPTRTQP